MVQGAPLRHRCILWGGGGRCDWDVITAVEENSISHRQRSMVLGRIVVTVGLQLVMPPLRLRQLTPVDAEGLFTLMVYPEGITLFDRLLGPEYVNEILGPGRTTGTGAGEEETPPAGLPLEVLVSVTRRLWW